MGRSKAGHAVTNLLLLLLIAGLYLGTTQPQTISVSAPVYRGQAEGKIANPALARRMAQDGHELATMGYAVGQDGRLSWVQEDVERSLEAIEAAAGVKPTLYYSGGRSVTVSGRVAHKLGLTQVLCTADLLCARGVAADILARLPQEPIPGSILLLQPTQAAGEALSGILTALREKGLEPVPVGEVLQ